MATTLGCLAFGAAAYAQAGDNDGCSNETLRGDYALRVSGQVFNAQGAVVALRDAIDMVEYDGAGNFTQKDFAFANGVLVPGPADSTGFHIDEGGTYTVNPDCTGKAVIRMAAPPGMGALGAIIEVMFVLSDHGRVMHQIVSSLMPPVPAPGLEPGTIRVAVPANIHADGEKLGPIGRER